MYEMVGLPGSISAHWTRAAFGVHELTLSAMQLVAECTIQAWQKTLRCGVISVSEGESSPIQLKLTFTPESELERKEDWPN